MSAKLVSVIEVRVYRASDITVGRIVTQYWSTDGKLLAENDPEFDSVATECVRRLTGETHSSHEYDCPIPYLREMLSRHNGL